MKFPASVVLIAGAALTSISVFAADTDGITQRDTHQQQRIEQGLQSGALTTREAGRLERDESRVNRMESQALKDGSLSDAEKRRIDRAQDQTSQDIYRQKHDTQVGNPNSSSSRRMQADVQRNIHQQQRIEQGVQTGQLTNREVGKLERGQSRISRAEGRAGADGHVGAYEQHRVQRREHRQSEHVYHEKHDGATNQ